MATFQKNMLKHKLFEEYSNLKNNLRDLLRIGETSPFKNLLTIKIMDEHKDIFELKHLDMDWRFVDFIQNEISTSENVSATLIGAIIGAVVTLIAVLLGGWLQTIITS